MEYYNATAKQLFEELERLQYSVKDKGNLASQAIQLISKTLVLLRKRVQDEGFEDTESEIKFFKYIKPQVTGHLIFYRHIHDIETKQLISTEEELDCFILKKKKDFLEFLRDNMEFVQYYRNRYNHLDKQYFLRNAFRVPLSHQNTDAFHDPEFTTPYDHIAAKLVAKDLFYKYLIDPLKTRIQDLTPTKLKWTANKSDLVELIYALHGSGALNEGEADLKDICTSLEGIFQIKVGELYRAFHDISNRKKEQVKFVNRFGEFLERKIEELDL